MNKGKEYFSIAEKYYREVDHYGQQPNRGRLWIKLHGKLLRDYEFCGLADDMRFHFLAMMLLAFENYNRLPVDIDFLAAEIKPKSKANFKKSFALLTAKGFLIRAKRKSIKAVSASADNNRIRLEDNNRQDSVVVESADAGKGDNPLSKYSKEQQDEYYEDCLKSGSLKNPGGFRTRLRQGRFDHDLEEYFSRRDGATAIPDWQRAIDICHLCDERGYRETPDGVTSCNHKLR